MSYARYSGLGGGGGGSSFNQIQLVGSTSGTLTLTVPAVVTSYTLTFPASQGGAGTTLVNDGSGGLTWQNAAGISIGNFDAQAGNAKGLALVGNVLSAQSATTLVPGMVNLTTQSFAGNKTFTGTIAASNLSGTNTGDQTITLTGDVTGSGTGSFAATIGANIVTNAKLAQMVAHTYKGNNTGSTANAIDVTSTQLTADLNLFTSGLQGLVPASGGGTTNFLRADGSFAAPVGTVSSVALSVPATSIFGVTGSPVTTTGTLGLTTTGTAFGIPYFSSTSQLATSAAGTATTVLHGNASGAPTWSQIVNADITNTTIDLTTKVTGTLPIANGGTAKTSVTTAPAASSWAGWDANSNLSAKNHIEGFTSTATAVGTTTLVVGSNYQQFFTGVTTQICQLPVATTLVNGQSFLITNLSTGAVSIQTSGSNVLASVPSNGSATVTCVNTAGGTGTASWSATTNNVGATTLPIASGGTGQTTANAALNALLPTQTGNAAKVLTTDATNAIWTAIPTAYFYGYFPSSTFWDRTNTALGDPTVNASATLVTVQSSNLGTVSQYTTGASQWLPGIVFTPVYTGRYEIQSSVGLEAGLLNTFAQIQHYDVTGSVALSGSLFRAASTNISTTLPIVSIISCTAATPRTITHRTAGSAGIVSITSNGLVNGCAYLSIKYLGP